MITPALDRFQAPGSLFAIRYAAAVRGRRIGHDFVFSQEVRRAWTPMSGCIALGYVCMGVTDLGATDFFHPAGITNIETTISRLRDDLSVVPFPRSQLIAFAFRRGCYVLGNPGTKFVRGAALDLILRDLPLDLQLLVEQLPAPAAVSA